MKTRQRVLMLGGVVVLAGVIGVLGASPARSELPGPEKGSLPGFPENQILADALATELGQASGLAPVAGTNGQIKDLPPVSGGVMAVLHAAYGPSSTAIRASGPSRGERDDGGETSFAVPPSRLGSQGCPNVFKREGRNDDDGRGGVDNVRVNQDCSLRRQAEEVVAVNPRDFSNVIAGQNDSRIGFNHCGYDWSLDRGGTWGDTGTSPPPFWQTILIDGHTTDACSDPAATFDHLGNAYVTGILFDIASAANGIFVAKSNYEPTAAPAVGRIKGRFYHTPRPVPYQAYLTDPMGKVASDIDPNIAHDKELMVADSRPGSAKKGRVYVTWTRFQAGTGGGIGRRSPIVFSQSTDGAATWSRAVIISGTSGSFCTIASGTPDNPNACDQDQGSHPVVGPDGTIYVIFGNSNTPGLGLNQVLMVKCPATNECDKETDWTAPTRIGDLIGLHPRNFPPKADPNGCPGGRRCLPPNGYRVPEFTSMSISVDRNSNLYATWADHRNNTNPKCEDPTPSYLASPPCDHDVFYAYSTNRGVTWSPTITVTPRSRLGETAQWQPWHDVMGDGSKVQVAFYDRHYGNCEFTGCNDITLATIGNPRSPNPRIAYRRITTSSMPNLIPANNPVQAGFLGDYMWVEVSRHNFDQRATHIVWADTRPLFGTAPEEDVYYARIGADGDDDDRD